MFVEIAGNSLNNAVDIQRAESVGVCNSNFKSY